MTEEEIKILTWSANHNGVGVCRLHFCGDASAIAVDLHASGLLALQGSTQSYRHRPLVPKRLGLNTYPRRDDHGQDADES